MYIPTTQSCVGALDERDKLCISTVGVIGAYSTGGKGDSFLEQHKSPGYRECRQCMMTHHRVD